MNTKTSARLNSCVRPHGNNYICTRTRKLNILIRLSTFQLQQLTPRKTVIPSGNRSIIITSLKQKNINSLVKFTYPFQVRNFLFSSECWATLFRNVPFLCSHRRTQRNPLNNLQPTRKKKCK